MTERLFLLVGGLSSKAFAVLVAGTSGFFGIVIGEALTNHIGLSALAGAIATTMAAVFLVIPRIMEQRRKSRESAAKVQSDAIALLMGAHDRDVAFYKAEIAALKLERAMLIDAKHKAAGEWMAALGGYRILVGQLRGLGQNPEIELHPAHYLDIVGEGDKALKEVAAARVAESPAKYPLAGE
jgi:hypothetical protein